MLKVAFQFSLEEVEQKLVGVEAKFITELHIKDFELLFLIRSFFNNIGQIGQSTTRQSAYFEVTKLDDLVNVIIPHFDKYPLQSFKRIDFLLWRDIVTLMKNKEHLIQSGLEEIVSIKSALNLGLSDKLKEAFPHVKVIVRPEFVVSEQSLNSYRVSGFTVGDGAFIFSTGANFYASYEIMLHIREELLLLKIREIFDSNGNVYSYPTKTSTMYRITALSKLNSFIIPHLDKYILSGVKLHNYLIWREIVVLLTKKAHHTPDG